MKLTYARAVKELEKAVEIRGADYISPECEIYVGNLNEFVLPVVEKLPQCIVGQVIYQIVGHEKFQEVSGGLVETPLASVGIATDNRAYELLRIAQEIQDSYVDDNDPSLLKNTWGTAVQTAKERA